MYKLEYYKDKRPGLLENSSSLELVKLQYEVRQADDKELLEDILIELEDRQKGAKKQ